MQRPVFFRLTYLNSEWEELPELAVGPVSSDDVLDELMRWFDVLDNHFPAGHTNHHVIVTAAHAEIEVCNE